MNALQPTTTSDVGIIGAGPAGLSLGFELKRHGIPFTLFEQGATVGDSWQRMPRHLKLVSPWKTNWLPGTAADLFPRHYRMSRQEFHTYLQRYAHDNQLPVRLRAKVHSVEKTNGLFRIQTSGGDFRSRLVVSAAGYFSQPFIPRIDRARDSDIPQLHVAHFHDCEQLREILGRPGGLVLIVGQRLSAGQTMVELLEAGFEVALSHRSPNRFGAGPAAGWVLFRIFPWLEWIKLKVLGRRAPNNDVRMEGGPARRCIRNRRVRTFPSIQRFDRQTVVFANGTELRVDLVIYATGFRPALSHLRPLDVALDAGSGSPVLRELESVSIPGLFFLGLDRGRNFQSRFIRGIRNDARFLAERLERRLARERD